MDRWKGDTVRLRAVEASDGDVVFGWQYDSDSLQASDWIAPPESRESVRRWIERATQRDSADPNAYLMIENTEGVVVGRMIVFSCDARTGAFRFGIAVDKEHRRLGYAREAVTLVLHNYFLELRYQKVNVEVLAFNTPALSLFESLGFIQEGCLRRVGYARGEYQDSLLFGMTREEFDACRPAG
jgi:RimJ/RimL family protein N-acetyltransferase